MQITLKNYDPNNSKEYHEECSDTCTPDVKSTECCKFFEKIEAVIRMHFSWHFYLAIDSEKIIIPRLKPKSCLRMPYEFASCDNDDDEEAVNEILNETVELTDDSDPLNLPICKAEGKNYFRKTLQRLVKNCIVAVNILILLILRIRAELYSRHKYNEFFRGRSNHGQGNQN